MGFWDAIVAAHMPFGLAPKIFNSIDMIVRVSEKFGMIDAVMMKL